MPFRVKVDEDLPTAITQMLNAAGYDVASVYGQGMGGWKDPPLWQAVQTESRFLVTADTSTLRSNPLPKGCDADGGGGSEVFARAVPVTFGSLNR